jgi:hypothetical protein
MRSVAKRIRPMRCLPSGTNPLQTNLTEFERQFVEKRLVEEQSNLDNLTASASLPQ